MFIFATIALEQFVDKLQQMPGFLNGLATVPTLKNSQNLYEKVIIKYNENNNFKKEKTNNQNDNRNLFQYNDNRSNKDMNNMSKMPLYQNEDHNRNYKGINNDKQNMGNMQQYMMQGQNNYMQQKYYQQQAGKNNQMKSKENFCLINFKIKDMDNSIYNNMQMNPADMNNMYLNNNMVAFNNNSGIKKFKKIMPFY